MYAATSAASSAVKAKFGMLPCFSHSNLSRFLRNCLLFAINANAGAGGMLAGDLAETWWQSEHAR